MYLLYFSIPRLGNRICNFCRDWNGVSILPFSSLTEIGEQFLWEDRESLKILITKYLPVLILSHSSWKWDCQNMCVIYSGSDSSENLPGSYTFRTYSWLGSHCLLLLLFFFKFYFADNTVEIPEGRIGNKRNYCYDCNTDLTNDWKVEWTGWKCRFMEF